MNRRSSTAAPQRVQSLRRVAAVGAFRGLGSLLFLLAVVSPSLGQSLPLTITNAAEARAEGAALAGELLAQTPVENFTQTGTLKIRNGDGKRSEVAVRFETRITATGWLAIYESTRVPAPTNDARTQLVTLTVTHRRGAVNQYAGVSGSGGSVCWTADGSSTATRSTVAAGEEPLLPFAGSDFWAVDLGLEFFHWPEQRLVRKELCRTRSCKVLESVNPQPTANGYSLVRSWIDRESLGIVLARAYDAQGKLLKEFSPKGMRKVNDQWQLREMEMDNVQTGSRSRIEFAPAAGP